MNPPRTFAEACQDFADALHDVKVTLLTTVVDIFPALILIWAATVTICLVGGAR